MMRNQSRLDAPNLTAVTEDVTRYASELEAGKLTSVGSLQVQRGAHLTMVAAEVKRGVSLAPDSWLTANHLEKVGGSITLKENSMLNAPQLGHIGGYADIDESAALVAPRFLS
jgi:hypothetical protein